MSNEKILEVGAEGGSTSFIKHTDAGGEKFVVRNSSHGILEDISSSGFDTYDSLRESFEAFASKNNLLIYFYPVFINPKYVKVIREQVLENPASSEGDHLQDYPNHPDWKEKLNDSLDQTDSLSDKNEQEFKIRRLERIQEYRYEHYADEKELQKVVTTQIDRPSTEIAKKGVGRVVGNTFVIEDADENIIGLYPLEQYSINPQL